MTTYEERGRCEHRTIVKDYVYCEKNKKFIEDFDECDICEDFISPEAVISVKILRNWAIRGMTTNLLHKQYCALCDNYWDAGYPEHHDEGCPAQENGT